MRVKQLKGLDEYSSFMYSYGLKNYAAILKRYKIIDKDMVLDAGCGPGHWSFAAALQNKKVVGIDNNDVLLKYAINYKNKNSNINDIHFYKGSVETLPFKNKQFDAVLCNSVIQYVNTDKAFSELSRVIKDGGVLIMFCNTTIGCYIRGLFESIYPINFWGILTRLKIIFYDTIFIERILGRASSKETFNSFDYFQKLGKKYGFTVEKIEDEPKRDYYRGMCKNGKYLGIKCVISVKCSKIKRDM